MDPFVGFDCEKPLPKGSPWRWLPLHDAERFTEELSHVHEGRRPARATSRSVRTPPENPDPIWQWPFVRLKTADD